MNDEPALLAAVLAAPMDDLPRLVYADWLDEVARVTTCDGCKGAKQVADSSTYIYGYSIEYVPCQGCSGTGEATDGRRERAAFIRTQCAFDRHPHAENIRAGNNDATGGWMEGFDLLIQGEALWRAHGARFVAGVLDARATSTPFVAEARGGFVRLEFRRGFVDRVNAPLAYLTAGLPVLTATLPITHARPTDVIPLAYTPEATSIHPEPGRFAWGRGPFAIGQHWLPAALWDKLPGPTGATRYKTYRTRDEAYGALSGVLLETNRRFA